MTQDSCLLPDRHRSIQFCFFSSDACLPKRPEPLSPTVFVATSFPHNENCKSNPFQRTSFSNPDTKQRDSGCGFAPCFASELEKEGHCSSHATGPGYQREGYVGMVDVNSSVKYKQRPNCWHPMLKGTWSSSERHPMTQDSCIFNQSRVLAQSVVALDSKFQGIHPAVESSSLSDPKS